MEEMEAALRFRALARDIDEVRKEAVSSRVSVALLTLIDTALARCEAAARDCEREGGSGQKQEIHTEA